LAAFRAAHGFGRAISAPQIGVPRRFIALNLGNGPLVMVNPEIVWKSAETFTMWDDCMSFPGLLVKVKRYSSISVCFHDEHGKPQEWLQLNQATSELLQHEIDHLDGILAVDRALDRDSLVLRETFEAQREYFQKQVDYVIAATGHLSS
jgi:peptide deformylase